MFNIGDVSDPYLYSTEVENIFIGEYMSAAPGEYVKVYLLGLMYAARDQGADHETIARQAQLSEEDVHKAWNYWESMGAVKKRYPDPEDRYRYDVTFLSLKEPLYLGDKSRQTGFAGEKRPENKEIKNMFLKIEKTLGRGLSSNEYAEIASWVTELSVDPALCVYVCRYAAKNLKKENVKYMGKILRGWVDKGIATEAQAEEWLSEVDRRHSRYRQVLKELGFSRNATEAEKAIMDKWFDEYGFSIEEVREACAKTAGISNPNIKYVNAVLEGRYKEQKAASGGSSPFYGDSRGAAAFPKGRAYARGKGKLDPIARTRRYYEELHEKARKEAAERRERIEREIPRIKELETELSKAFSEMTSLVSYRGSDRENRVSRINDTIAKIEREQRGLLKKAGYGEDYLEVPYRCKKCKDTGFLDDGSCCSCFNERMQEAMEGVQ